jgi:quercetin dioxygenase-like cupin family protein
MLNTNELPWIPLGGGESFKPLRFYPNDRGRALLLRVEPGTVIARHRHHGEVHAFNLSGQRRLDTGEIVGPGGYVYEPVGNVDSWSVVGDEPVVVYIVTFGTMEYLGDNDEVLRRDNAASLREIYINYCSEHGITPMDLG